MIYHVLNGDSLAYTFQKATISGEVVVCREALIDGSLTGDNLNDFWRTRAAALEVTDAEYENVTVKEFEKILNAPQDSEFNLWFEYDLFCQTNMWFVLSLIQKLSINRKVYVVYTSHLNRTDKNFWSGFGPAQPADLRLCLANKIALSDSDISFGAQLWKARKNIDLDELDQLAQHHSPAFPFLTEVIQANRDRFPHDGQAGKPKRVITDIVNTISTDFPVVFKEFWRREGIYGFGDTQIRKIYDDVMRELKK